MGCSDLVWKLRWETVIIQALSTDNSQRMLVTHIPPRMLETSREQLGMKRSLP